MSTKLASSIKRWKLIHNSAGSLINPMESPIVSVILPTYNRAYCIADSINSVLEQTFKEFELIVVDDGSTDDTHEIVMSISDSRIKYIYQLHSGACSARNTGIDLARGAFIAFQDSDDKWETQKLELQLRALSESGANCCICKMDVRTAEGVRQVPEKQPNFTLNEILAGNYISTQMLVCRRECFKNLRFDDRLPRLQDWDLAIRLIANESFILCKGVLVTQYIRNDSISTNESAYARAVEIILGKHIDLYCRHPVALSQMLLVAGNHYYEKRRFDFAISFYISSLSIRWNSKVALKWLVSFLCLWSVR